MTISASPDLTTISSWTADDYATLTPDIIQVMTDDQVQAMQHPEWIPLSAVSGLTASQVAVISTSFSPLPPGWLNNLALPAFQAMTTGQVAQLTAAQVAGLDTTHLTALTATQVGAITSLSGLSSLQFSLLDISAMPVATINAWTSTEYAGLTKAQVASLSPQQIAAIASPTSIPYSAVSGLTPAQVPYLKSGTYYSAGWVNQLTIPAMQALTLGQVYNIKRPQMVNVDDAHLAAMTAAQVAGTNKLDGLSSHQYGLLNISLLSTSSISGMSAVHLAGLTATQIASLSPAQVAAFVHPEQLSLTAISGLTVAQISAIKMNFSQFSADWFDALSIPTFEAMTADQANQIPATTISALDPAHQSALATIQAEFAAAANANLADTTSLAGVSTTTIAAWAQADYNSLTAHQISTMSTQQVLAMAHPDWMPAAAAAGFTAAQIPFIKISLASFSASWLNNLSPAALQALSTTQLNQISASTMQGLNNSQLAALSASQVAAATNLGTLGSTQFSSLDISQLSVSAISGLSQAYYSGLTTGQVASLSVSQIAALNHPDWLLPGVAAALSPAQASALAGQEHGFSSAFLNNMSIPAFTALTGSQLSGMSAAAIDGLDANHLSIFSDFSGLKTNELLSVAAGLSTQQLQGLSQNQQALLSASASTGQALIGSLSDGGLQGIMQSLVSANQSLFSFSSVVAVLKSFAAELTGPLSAGQYSDLCSYVQDIGGVCGVNSPLYSLANGMVNGANGASVDWTGSGSETRIGHLAAGASADLFNQQIATWFDGTNEPPNSSVSRIYGQQLYANNVPSVNDIHQGTLGDCSFLSALQAVVHADPDYIKSMIVENPNNTYSVRFFKGNQAEWVTVDKTSYSLGTSGYGSWASLLEHAFVNFTSTYNGASNIYSSLIGDTEKLQQITGDSLTTYYANNYTATDWNTTVHDALKAAVLAGQPAEIGSHQSSTDPDNGREDLVSGHMMSINGYDAQTDKFIVSNPWGADWVCGWNGTFEASMDTLRENGASKICFVNSQNATGVVGQLVSAMAAVAPAAGTTSVIAPASSANNTTSLVVAHAA